MMIDVFLEITFHPNEVRRVIHVDTTNPGQLYLIGDKEGLADLAECLLDFVVSTQPEKVSYVFAAERGLTKGSPELVFEYDASLDEAA